MKFKSYTITELQKKKNKTKVLIDDSWRHHYIPQFLITGFANKNNKLYVYDKSLEKILAKPYSAKSIFFEKDRNTIDIEGNRSTYLENVVYNIIDNADSEIVKYLRDNELNNIELNNELKSRFLCFIINLFWRNPSNDELFELVYSQFDLKNQTIFNKDSFKKTLKSTLTGFVLDEIAKMNLTPGEINLSEYPSDIYIISDNPLLFRKIPDNFSEFGSNDFLLPISSKRMFYSSKKIMTDYNEEMAQHYNLQVINQSNKYVASGNKDLLEENISLYHKYKSEIPKWINYAFVRNN